MSNNLKYEDNIDEINRIISVNINKWKLSGAIPSISKEDVEQDLRLKIFIKWKLYNPEKGPLPQWLTAVVCNEIKNHLRDHYYRFANVCVSCPANLSGGQCKLYGHTECLECPLYQKWAKDKKQQHDIKLPVALDNHTQEVSEKPWEENNIFRQIDNLKEKLKEKLSDNDYYIFTALYLDNKKEDQIIEDLKFTSRAQGVRTIKQLKDMIIPLVKQIISREELV